MLGFGFTFGSNFSFLSLKLIITRKHTQKQRKIRPRSALASHADALLARHATLPWAGTRDEPALRTSAWDATSTRILFASKIQCQRFSVEFFTFYYQDIAIIRYKDEKSQRISQWKYGYSINLVPRVLSYPPYGTLRRAGRREPCERDCYSMSSIFWPDRTIVLNPILETSKKRKVLKAKSLH